jgi:hypothetical protein
VPAGDGGVGTAASAPPRSGPADAAREELAKVVGPRPARAPVKKATSGRTASAAAPRPEPAPPGGPPDAPAPPADGGAAQDLPDRDALLAAWPEVLGTLKRGTRSLYGTGRFVEPSDGVILFALDNGPTRDHCEKSRPEVEAALATRFGRPVPLRLVTLGEAGGGPSAAASPQPDPTAQPPAAAAEEDEVVDVHDLTDAPSAASGVDRLAEAFPGAELVEDP